MQQETMSVTLLQNHLLKSRKRRKLFDDEIDHCQHNKERDIIEEECDFAATVLMGVEPIQNLKKDGTIGRRSNVDRQNVTNWCGNVYDSKWNSGKTRTNILPTPIKSQTASQH